MYKDRIEEAIQTNLERRYQREELIQKKQKAEMTIDELNDAYDMVVQAEDKEAAMMAFMQEYGKEGWDRVLRNKATAQRRKETMNQ